MYAHRPAGLPKAVFRKEPLGQRKGERKPPLVPVRRANVLEQLKRRAPRSAHQPEKPLRIAGPERLRLPQHARVLIKKVHRAQDGAIRHPPAQCGDGLAERLRLHLREHIPSEQGRHAAHILRNGRILLRKAGVTAAGVDQTQPKAERGRVDLHPLHRRPLRIEKIDHDEAAGSGHELIHPAAGLAEERALRLLRSLREYRRVVRAAIERAHAGAHQHLKRRRGGEPRAGRHIRADNGVKPAGGQAARPPSRRHAAHKRRRRACFRRHGRERIERNPNRRIALRVDADAVLPVRRGARDAVERHRRGEHAPALVVGVVAADLRAARCGNERSLRPRAELRQKPVEHRTVPRPLCRHGFPAAEPPQRIVQPALAQ